MVPKSAPNKIVSNSMMIRHPVPREKWNSFLSTILKKCGRIYDNVDKELEEALNLYIEKYG